MEMHKERLALSRRARRELLGTLAAAGLLALLGCAVSEDASADYWDRYDRGVADFRLKRFEEAKSAFEGLLRDYPDVSFNRTVKLRIASCDYLLGNSAEARRVYVEVLQTLQDPENRVLVLQDLGNLELQAGNYPVAARYLREAARLRTEPKERAEIELRLGIALQQGGEFAEGRTVLERVAASGGDPEVIELARSRLKLPDYFTVQVGAYGRRQNAEEQRASLGAAGFPAKIALLETERGTLYRVWVGEYRTRAEAERASERLVRSLALASGTEPLVIP